VSLDPAHFREALSHWATGVTIVTSRDTGGRPQGMTVSSFCSVSLSPPLVLFCAGQSSTTHASIETSKVFGVSLLGAAQRSLSERFSLPGNEAERFDGLDCSDGVTGCPRIPGALAWLDCRVVQAIFAGDHIVYVAEVEHAELPGGSPLLYHRGRYTGLR
jgi:flavin reductase (DIM6/NTAB) family NADH-FMN oxidoreductase RutF